MSKIKVTDIDSGTATAGQAPLADGSGGAAWGDVAAGGGGGNVTGLIAPTVVGSMPPLGSSSSSSYAGKGNLILPAKNLDIEAVTAYMASADGSSHIGYILELNDSNQVVAITATSSVVVVSGTSAQFQVFPFSSTVGLVADTRYALMVFRTDSSGTTSQGAYGGGSGTTSYVEFADALPSTYARLAATAPTVGATLDTGTTGYTVGAIGRIPAEVSGGGPDFPGNDWVDLTWGTPGTYHGGTCTPSVETVTGLAAGDEVELRVYMHRTRDTSSSIYLSDGTNALLLTTQSDNNIVAYRTTGSSNSALGASGSSGGNDFTAWVEYRILLKVTAAGDYSVAMYCDDKTIAATSYYQVTSWTLGDLFALVQGETGSTEFIGQMRRIKQTDTPLLPAWGLGGGSSGGGGGGSGGSVSGYRIPFSFAYTPNSGELLLIHTFAIDVDFPADLAGSVGYVGANPASDYVFTLSDGTSTLGTITVSSAGAVTFNTGGVGMSFAAGDVLLITAQASTDTIANSGFTLRGALGDYLLPYGFSPTPNSGEVLLISVFADDVLFPINFSGSVGYVTTNPTASFAMDVQKNGVTVGTVTVGTDGSVSFATTGAVEVTFSSGDAMTVVAPATVDATIADCGFTFKGGKL